LHHEIEKDSLTARMEKEGEGGNALAFHVESGTRKKSRQQILNNL